MLPCQSCHCVVAEDHGTCNDRLLFRERLRSHPEAAREYACLKYSLAERFRDDREAYTAAKTDSTPAVVEWAKGLGPWECRVTSMQPRNGCVFSDGTIEGMMRSC